MKLTIAAVAFIAGITATILIRPRIPAMLWWLFSRGDT